MKKAKEEFMRVVAEKVGHILTTNKTYGEARKVAGVMSWSSDRFEQMVGKEVFREIDERFAYVQIEKPPAATSGLPTTDCSNKQ